MKNIQIIDGADNCSFSIFQANEVEFALVFPVAGQDIEFAEDLGQPALDALSAVWERPIRKQDARGIHGTLFYGFESKRAHFPASKKEKDWASSALNEAQRQLFRKSPQATTPPQTPE